jgi:hypothetical protein
VTWINTANLIRNVRYRPIVCRAELPQNLIREQLAYAAFMG